MRGARRKDQDMGRRWGVSKGGGRVVVEGVVMTVEAERLVALTDDVRRAARKVR